MTLGALFLAATARPLAAQGDALCAGYATGANNSCNAAVGAARLFAPAIGSLVSAGSATPGETRGSGRSSGLGAIGRVNVTRIVIPDLAFDGSTTTVGARKTLIAFAPLFETAVELYHGTSSHALALDALVSVQFLPTGSMADVRVDRNALRLGNTAIGFGFGARLTLIPEGYVAPEIAVSATRRGIPRLGVGSVAAGDLISFVDDLHVMNYRATIGKRLGAFSFGGGVGMDRYAGKSTVTFRHASLGNPQELPTFSMKDDRLIAFANAGMRAGRLDLVAEGGMQQGADLGLAVTYTSNNPRDRRLFGSLGLRLGL